jgi:tetratricopeptide (TPR) repeat protein
VNSLYLNSTANATDERTRLAEERARRALSLDPKLFEARRAWARFLVRTRSAATAAEAEPILQQLRVERPGDLSTLGLLGRALLTQKRLDDAKALYADLDVLTGTKGSGTWIYYQAGFIREADAALDQANASRPRAVNIGLKIHFALAWHGDLDLAALTLARLTEQDRRIDQGVAAAVYLHVWRREPEKLLTLLQQVPREWLTWSINGPKDAIMGDALAKLGRTEGARLSWQQAMKQVETRLAAEPDSRNLLAWKMYLQDALGDAAGFAQTKRLFTELPGRPNTALLQYDLRSRNATEDEILTELESAIKAGSRSLNYTPNALRLNPAFDKVRTTPRFQALLPLAEANARANDLMPPGK